LGTGRFYNRDVIKGIKMAEVYYLTCGECGKRLYYDGKKTIRLALELRPVFCEKCWVKLNKKIELLKKHDRRRH
jgi:hypothetical protein